MEHKTKSDMKFERVMREFAHGKLESHGKKVTDQKQAVAIAFSEARKINPAYGMKNEGGSMGSEEMSEEETKQYIRNLSQEDWNRLKPENKKKYDKYRNTKSYGGSMADSGKLEEIYSKGTAKQLWEFWNEEDRIHFMIDHTGKQHTPVSLEELSKKAYNFLPIDIKKEVVIHHATGMYKKGGPIVTGSMKDANKLTMANAEGAIIKKKNSDQFDIPLKVMRIYDDEIGVGALNADRPIMTIAKNQFYKWEIIDTKKMKKGGPIKLDSLQNLKDVLDGIAIDLEGEDETSLASFRFELDDAKTSEDTEKIISDYEKDWLDDISDKKAKAEIKKAISQYRSIISGRDWSETDDATLDKLIESLSLSKGTTPANERMIQRMLSEAKEEKKKRGSKTKSGKLTPSKRKLQDRINTLERTKANANAAAQKSIQKKIDKLREQFNYNPGIKERIAAQKGRFYLDVPTQYAKRIYKSLWKMDIKPELHTLHGNTKVVVNNSRKLEKAYKIYSDILSEKNLPVPPLSKIKGKL